jgi:hypothetical protein
MQIQTLLEDVAILMPISTDKVENAHAGVQRVVDRRHWGRKLLDDTAEERSFLNRIQNQYKELCARASETVNHKKAACWRTAIKIIRHIVVKL